MGSQTMSYQMNILGPYAHLSSQSIEQYGRHVANKPNVGHSLSVRWAGTCTPVVDYNVDVILDQELPGEFLKKK
jgi:hypothetical protein